MRTIWCALGVAVTIASGCSVLAPIPDQSRYFTLSAPGDTRADAEGRVERSADTRVVYGLGPVILPAYLDRNEIATRVSPTEITYSPTEHRWWRLRNHAGQFLWETSPDGRAWTTQASEPAESDPLVASIHVEAGTEGPDPAPGTAVLDNFNVPPP